MPRRKLRGTLTEDEHDSAIINGHNAEESMADIYHKLRERLGARHPLTLKAEGAMRRINALRQKLSNADFMKWLS